MKKLPKKLSDCIDKRASHAAHRPHAAGGGTVIIRIGAIIFLVFFAIGARWQAHEDVYNDGYKTGYSAAITWTSLKEHAP
jgi:hypothetical protein